MEDLFTKYEGVLTGLFVFALAAGVVGLYAWPHSTTGYTISNLSLSPSSVLPFTGFVISFAVFFAVIFVLALKNSKD